MKIIEIAFTAYAVTDVRKSRAFYEGVLGLTPNSEYDGSNDAKYVEYNIGPGTLSIGASEMWKPSQDGASVALEVDDFDKALAYIKEKGVPIHNGPHDFPSCSMVVLLDPDKNKVTLHKRKKK